MTSLFVAGRPTLTNLGLVSACERLGVEAALCTPAEVTGRAAGGSTVLGRLDVLPSLDGIEEGLWELQRLAPLGVRVLNRPDTLLAAHDKLATAIQLGAAGIPHPRTAHVGDDGLSVELDLPVVVKPRFGSWGRDVVRCTTRSQLRTALRRLRRREWFRRQGALVQELVPPVGYDLRLLVAGGRVIGAVKRLAAYGEWRTNVALGALRVPVEPPPAAVALAVEAAAAIGADLVGVDLLPLTTGGHVVLELNGAVEFTAEYALGGRDVFERAVEELLPAGASLVGLAAAGR